MAQIISLYGRTDNGEECNRFSLQNCGADTPLVCSQPPLFASNDDLVTGGVATASAALTRPVVGTTMEPSSKRRQKPLQKACENADDSAARASRLKRTNRAAQARECDFSHPNSVNKCFPHYRHRKKKSGETPDRAFHDHTMIRRLIDRKFRHFLSRHKYLLIACLIDSLI